MCEITRLNFKDKLPEIEKSLQKAKFIALDLEFSALQGLQTPRLFDSNRERYAKLRTNLLHVIPLQVGLTAFHFNDETDDYSGDVYTFYVQPATFAVVNKSFYFQASTLEFLTLHKFDFNKFAHLGVPYINNEEEKRLEKLLKTNDFLSNNTHMRTDFQDLMNIYFPVISKWYRSSKIGDFLDVPDILNKYRHFNEIIYCLHKDLRSRFQNLWTCEVNSVFRVKKVTSEEYKQLESTYSLISQTINDLNGFKHVYNLLTTLRKPIIGHNILQDIMIMINNFENPLPDSYSQFKGAVNNLFPTIFDTKTIYYELKSTIPKEKLPDDTSLKDLFHYFKDGLGRHLVMNTSAIEAKIDLGKVERFHDAGWDSFCTGYIFLRMAHYNIARRYPKNKKFVSSEMISALSEYKNRVNVIRASASHIKLDGEDPSSNRPPWLIVESLKNEPVDINDLMSSLSSYGFVDIKRLSSNGKRVLVAVDNYRSAREITRTFKVDSKFQIKQYNVLKHSPLAQALLLGTITISGTILIWLTHAVIKR